MVSFTAGFICAIFLGGSLIGTDGCWIGWAGDWGSWGTCDVTCGGGERSSRRTKCMAGIGSDDEEWKYESCNEFCNNGGYYSAGGCHCPSWRDGRCCDDCSHIQNCHQDSVVCYSDGSICHSCVDTYYSGGKNRGCIHGAITDITQAVGSDVVVTSALAGIPADDKATTLTLAENFAAETAITTLTIAGATTPLTWAIATTANVGLLTVNAGVVALAANKAFDFETSPVVTSVITGVDAAELTATVTLTLSVTNVDDNDPVFNPDSYAVTILKGSAAGKELVTVTATDADGDVIAYSLSGAGNTNSDWTIGGTTGTIAVATGKTIEEASYSLVVLATSGTPAKTDSATVAVTVDDTDPVFNHASCAVTIAKGSAAGTLLYYSYRRESYQFDL